MRLRSRASFPFARLVGATALLATTQCGDPEIVTPTSTSTGTGGAGQGGSGVGGSGTGAGFSQGGGTTTSSTGGSGGGAVEPFCGDGVKGSNEACDDGNAQSGDGCTGDCGAIESGYACLVPGQPCISTVVCGDGVIGGAETCDDGQSMPASGDGCLYL